MDVNEESVSFKHLLNPKVLIPVTSQPLFLAMPVNIDGLGLTSRNVGYILGTYGFANSIFQIVVLGRLIRRFGSRLSLLLPSPLSFPCIRSLL